MNPTPTTTTTTTTTTRPTTSTTSTSTTTTSTTTTTTTSTTTTTIGTNCCPVLVANQFTNQTTFAYGDATITFDSTTCRMSASVTCSSPDFSLGLEAAIRVNFQFYLIAAINTVVFPATCVNGVWQMANPPLVVNQLECLLANAGGIG
uniref:C6 domain-containing protein n=1 Tax=Acrobeloides nanus TaxID=290746 RepID=A0A914CTJ0_9BILA